jgi:hypothetical protein
MASTTSGSITGANRPHTTATATTTTALQHATAQSHAQGGATVSAQHITPATTSAITSHHDSKDTRSQHALVGGTAPPTTATATSTTGTSSTLPPTAPPTTTSSSSAASSASAAGAPTANAESKDRASATTTVTSGAVTATPLATGESKSPSIPRTKYKTYILSDAVFEVEQRYEIKEIVGHGAYGIVWYYSFISYHLYLLYRQLSLMDMI